MTDVEKIKGLIEQAEELVKARVTFNEPGFKLWKSRMERFLTKKYGKESTELKIFENRLFRPALPTQCINHDMSIECIQDLDISISELKDYLSDEEDIDCNQSFQSTVHSNKVFIIHGHDSALKNELARLIENQGISAIILSEQVNQGKTIIEKFEEYSEVGAAIALFTKDDFGRSKESEKDAPRARQNVVFETGFFMGKLRRDKIVIIAENGVELPSDLHGVVYTDKEDWKTAVCRELKAMNYNIDLNKLL